MDTVQCFGERVKKNILPTFSLRTWRWRLLFLAFSGILTGLTLIVPALGVLQWLSLIPAMLVLYDMARQEQQGVALRLRRVYAVGLVFFMCYYLMCFHWFLAMYPLRFTDLTRGAALFVVMFAWWGLSLFQALGAAFVFVAFIALSRLSLLRRVPFLRVPLIGALWIVLEWGQTLFWTGVPWGRLCLGQAAVPVMLGTASLFGSYIISLMLLLFNAALAYGILHLSRLRLCAALCAGVLLFTAGGGVLTTLLTDKRTDDGQSVKVAAIQGNVGSADKWDAKVSEIFEIYYRMTKEAAMAGVDLVVWPETAVPVTLQKYPTYIGALQELADEYDVTLILGVFTENKYQEKYNSTLFISPEGEISDTVYSKRHLVPFGEYVPMQELILVLVPPLADLVQADVLPGEDAAVYASAYGGIASLICFDSIYETLAQDAVRSGAELLTVSTNDSWFFDSAAASMHLAQAQLRAIETGRYVVRAANTGISAIITPTGEITATQEALSEGIVYGEVFMCEGTTLYTRMGNAVVWLCMAYAAGILLLGAACAAYEKRQRAVSELPMEY